MKFILALTSLLILASCGKPPLTDPISVEGIFVGPVTYVDTNFVSEKGTTTSYPAVLTATPGKLSILQDQWDEPFEIIIYMDGENFDVPAQRPEAGFLHKEIIGSGKFTEDYVEFSWRYYTTAGEPHLFSGKMKRQ